MQTFDKVLIQVLKKLMSKNVFYANKCMLIYAIFLTATYTATLYVNELILSPFPLFC